MTQYQEIENDKTLITIASIAFNDEIISIEENDEEELIDIEVSDDHLFYANDILTKNSMAIPQTADVAWILGQDPMDVVYFNEIQMKTLKNRISGKVGEILKLYNNPGSLKLYDASEMDEWIKSHGLAEVDLKYINDDIQSQDMTPLTKDESVPKSNDKKSETMTSFIDDLRG